MRARARPWVLLRACRGGAWRAVARLRTGPDGRFRWRGRAGLVQAQVEPVDGFPYASATSRAVRGR